MDEYCIHCTSYKMEVNIWMCNFGGLISFTIQCNMALPFQCMCKYNLKWCFSFSMSLKLVESFNILMELRAIDVETFEHLCMLIIRPQLHWRYIQACACSAFKIWTFLTRFHQVDSFVKTSALSLRVIFLMRLCKDEEQENKTGKNTYIFWIMFKRCLKMSSVHL